MEQQGQTQDSGLFGLNVDQGIKAHLSETAKWGKFLAIVGFIICALVLFAGIFVVTAVSSIESPYGNEVGSSFTKAFGPALVIVYILIAVVYFFPCLFLLRFANKMKSALAADNQADLNVSFQNLKVCFRYVGILFIIVLSFYVLALLFGGLGMMLGR